MRERGRCDRRERDHERRARAMSASATTSASATGDQRAPALAQHDEPQQEPAVASSSPRAGAASSGRGDQDGGPERGEHQRRAGFSYPIGAARRPSGTARVSGQRRSDRPRARHRRRQHERDEEERRLDRRPRHRCEQREDQQVEQRAIRPSQASPRASAQVIERKLQAANATSAASAALPDARRGEARRRRPRRDAARNSSAAGYQDPGAVPPSWTAHHAKSATAAPPSAPAASPPGRRFLRRSCGQHSFDRRLTRHSMERMPRVLILITLAEPGGAQTYVAHLLPALATRYEVVVAAYGDGPLREAAREAGVRFVGLRHVRRRAAPGRDLLGLIELMVLIRRRAPRPRARQQLEGRRARSLRRGTHGACPCACSPCTAGRSRRTPVSRRSSTAGPTG